MYWVQANSVSSSTDLVSIKMCQLNMMVSISSAHEVERSANH